MAVALVALLKQVKYDADHLADGASALAALESDVYDIAVLDVMMPEMNGSEVARRARNKGIYSEDEPVSIARTIIAWNKEFGRICFCIRWFKEMDIRL